MFRQVLVQSLVQNVLKVFFLLNLSCMYMCRDTGKRAAKPAKKATRKRRRKKTPGKKRT